MAPTTPVSLLARQRLREHQAAGVKALANHSAALARLDAVISRRDKVVGDQDTLVATANADVITAVSAVVQIMGVTVAADILGLSATHVRRITKDAR
jgi:hypothetical protein